MVLDEVGGVPILASWWPLCATAMVHRRDIDGRGVGFGNQGDLCMNAMTWWDHDTSSVWSQPMGEAILGPLEGERLELVPSTLTEWRAWKRSHPRTVALDAEGGKAGFTRDGC